MEKPFLVGITGGSGSGKTTLLQAISDSFDPKDLSILSQDNYYLPKEEQQEDQNGIINFDLPRCFDKKQFKKDIEKLMSGQEVVFKEYTFNNDKAEEKTIVIKPAPIIIIEGLFIFHFKKIVPLFDLKVFVHAKENLKVIRRIKRDRVERNYPLDDVLYRYEHHVLPTFEKYIEPYMEKADIIINNNSKGFSVGLDVLRGYLRQVIPTQNSAKKG